MIWFVYVIQSSIMGKLYTGISTDHERRLRQHNSGTGAKATRGIGPWKNVLLEEYVSKSAALKREAAIKKLTRAEKLALVGLA